MTIAREALNHLSDADLLSRVRLAVERERAATTHLIALLMELDARRLYLAEGCSSLFTYCTQVLHLTEHAAYGRIEAARIARRFPVVLERLEAGTLSLTAICLLGPHLTPDNHVTVLDAAGHKSKREVEQIVAGLQPVPDVPAAVRRLPVPQPLASAKQSADAPSADAPRQADRHVQVVRPALAASPVVKPLTPERFKLQLTISRETHDKLRRVQDLLRHRFPNGDLEKIVDRALTLLLEQAERTKLAATTRPRSACDQVSATRHIPAGVKRAVWQRDEGRCAFLGAKGRCRETGFLEFHHVVPFAAGGETSVANLQLRCRQHNVFHGQQSFGDEQVARE